MGNAEYMGSLATEKKKMGNSLGHKVQSTLGGFRPRFKIKNNTKREIFVKLTLEKIDLPVRNIMPGWLENPTPDRTRKRDKAAQLVDKFGSLMKIAVAEKADEQRNNVVFDIFPKEHGFKEVFPGESYKSHKKWKMLKGFKGAAYLTVLTREFLLEDVLTGEGGRRIDNNPVDSKTYNVSFYNKKLGALHQKEKIIITRNPKYGEHKVYCQ